MKTFFLNLFKKYLLDVVIDEIIDFLKNQVDNTRSEVDNRIVDVVEKERDEIIYFLRDRL